MLEHLEIRIRHCNWQKCAKIRNWTIVGEQTPQTISDMQNSVPTGVVSWLHIKKYGHNRRANFTLKQSSVAAVRYVRWRLEVFNTLNQSSLSTRFLNKLYSRWTIGSSKYQTVTLSLILNTIIEHNLQVYNLSLIHI